MLNSTSHYSTHLNITLVKMPPASPLLHFTHTENLGCFLGFSSILWVCDSYSLFLRTELLHVGDTGAPLLFLVFFCHLGLRSLSFWCFFQFHRSHFLHLLSIPCFVPKWGYQTIFWLKMLPALSYFVKNICTSRGLEGKFPTQTCTFLKSQKVCHLKSVVNLYCI